MIKGDMTGIAAAEEIKRNWTFRGVPRHTPTELHLSQAKLAEPHSIFEAVQGGGHPAAVEMALHKHSKEMELKTEADFLRSMAEHEDAEVIFVKNRSRLMRVKHSLLFPMEALKDYVVVHREESYTIHSTMKEVERKLSDRRFIRVHRSYIVNLHAIESMKYSNITMEGIEKEIPVGARTRTCLQAASTSSKEVNCAGSSGGVDA